MQTVTAFELAARTLNSQPIATIGMGNLFAHEPDKTRISITRGETVGYTNGAPTTPKRAESNNIHDTPKHPFHSAVQQGASSDFESTGIRVKYISPAT